MGALSLLTPMSLISQKDRQMVIEALEYYVYDMEKNNCNEAAIYSYNTLLNWIRLEYFKHEDSTVVL
jgi:hypothetical protein